MNVKTSFAISFFLAMILLSHDAHYHASVASPSSMEDGKVMPPSMSDSVEEHPMQNGSPSMGSDHGMYGFSMDDHHQDFFFGRGSQMDQDNEQAGLGRSDSFFEGSSVVESV